jgi:LmbE family N-acetylglucosaminyl deacetylase
VISATPSTWRGRKVLLLAPHADDVAYSIGGLVAGWAGQVDGTLLTVFGRSGWALPRALRKQGVAAITAERLAEDRAYCARRGLRHDYFDCADSVLLGYDDAGELAARPEQDPRTGDIGKLVADFVATMAPDLVLAPCALGGHIDHAIVRRAAAALAGVEVLYYEDVPYSATLSLAALERELGAAGLVPAVAIDIDAVYAAKCDDMWLYRSQTSAPTIAEMRLHAQRLGTGAARHVERLWRPC